MDIEGSRLNVRRLKTRLMQHIRERAITIADYKMFTLSSGKKTDMYVDMRIITQQSDTLWLIGQLVYEQIKDTAINCIGGPAMGSIPIVTSALTYAASVGDHLNGFFVRESTKAHGTEQRIEGSVHPDDVVWLFDDVATTGDSLVRTANILRGYSCVVIGATTLVCRNPPIKHKMSIDHNLSYDYFFSLREILEGMARSILFP